MRRFLFASGRLPAPHSLYHAAAAVGLTLFLATTATAADREILLVLSNRSTVARRDEPVTAGVPLPRGFVSDASKLGLRDKSGKALPLSALTTDAYADGSPRWVLLDLRANVAARGQEELRLRPGARKVRTPGKLDRKIARGVAEIDTGAARFRIDTKSFRLWDSVKIDGVELLGDGGRATGIVFEDESGTRYNADASVTAVAFEDEGPLRAVLRLRGEIHPAGKKAGGGRLPLANWLCRMHFYAGLAEVRVFFTLHNPAAHTHPGNIWDLGSGGSLYMEDLSLVVPLADGGAWQARVSDGDGRSTRSRLELYQDSSGGPNWRSANHVDKDHEIPVSFRGYRVVVGDKETATGNEARGWLHAHGRRGGVAVGIREFWQNFPKALEFSDDRIRVALWPREFAGVHEILGGEQKTHEMLFVFHDTSTSRKEVERRMEAFRQPIWALPDIDSVIESRAFWPTAPLDRKSYEKLEDTCDAAVYPRGRRRETFIKQWDVIDEYGWRHFGDTFADNERASAAMVREFPDHHVTGNLPISHFVNEYEPIYAVMVQGLRRADAKWMWLADVMARHHADICVYHTDVGAPAYSHGPFMHTTHDTAAYRSTFRSYPIEAKNYDLRYGQGGGPNAGHTYVASLAQHYWLTGDRISRDAFLEVAGWAADSSWFRKPMGDKRGYGNFLMTFVYAYRLTDDRKFYDRAMTLVGWIDEPFEGLGGNLFVKAAGRFLEMKVDNDEIDADYRKVRDLLLRFGDLYLTLPESRWNRWLEQRCFHAEVLCTAYLHAPKDHPRRDEYRERGRQILDEGLDRFPGHYVPTKTWAMCFANTGAYFRVCAETQASGARQPKRSRRR